PNLNPVVAHKRTVAEAGHAARKVGAVVGELARVLRPTEPQKGYHNRGKANKDESADGDVVGFRFHLVALRQCSSTAWPTEIIMNPGIGIAAEGFNRS